MFVIVAKSLVRDTVRERVRFDFILWLFWCLLVCCTRVYNI